jgi:hypothetical protein
LSPMAGIVRRPSSYFRASASTIMFRLFSSYPTARGKTMITAGKTSIEAQR